MRTALEAGHGVIVWNHHRRLRSTISRLVGRGELVRLHPGVYSLPDPSYRIRLVAICAWIPDAVICGSTAFRIHNGELESLTGPYDIGTAIRRAKSAGIRFHAPIPPEFTIEVAGIRLASVAFAATELARKDEGKAMDLLLRAGLVEPGEFLYVSTWLTRRRGCKEIRRRALESFTNPWSGGERELHRVLRAGRLEGWSANVPLHIGGRWIRPDVLFPEAGLVVEFDGMEFHSDPATRRRDYERQNALIAEGYAVLRFTWEMLIEDPGGVRSIVRATLRERSERQRAFLAA